MHTTHHPAGRRKVLRLGSLLVSFGLLGPLAVAGTAAAAAAAPSAAGAAAGATPAAASCVTHLDPRLAGASGGSADVIVLGRPGADSAVARAVTADGGRVTTALPLVDGVRATVPDVRLRELSCADGVAAVTPNSTVRFQSRTHTAPATGSNFVTDSGALPLWQRRLTGRGVGVAVIDTGISPMPDLAGRVVYGPDLSGEGSTIDSYGHGTVMAGLIGGDGADSAAAAGGPYTGMAPGATLVSVKVAGRNGATDVSTVLQAMHWVSAYRKQFNIRVLNLSWGTPSTQSPTIDPLDYAVERLWREGIVVVVAAGNSGPTTGTILKPADDPLVLTVGAYDTGDGTGPDTVPAWSSAGPTAAGYAKPDLVAPGRTLIAQRSYGSAVEADNPSALIAPSYIKGSGTSEAAAVTSGSVALLLQARPDLTPDQVKHILTGTARPISGTDRNHEGAGRLSLADVLRTAPGRPFTQRPVATGLGSLEASRGGMHVETDCGQNGTVDVIQGEIDVRCEPWNPWAWTHSAWTGAAWTGAAWTGAAWTGAAWTGGNWTGAAWTGAAWTGGNWTGAAWTGAAWTGAAWTGSAWTGAAWTGAAWTGAAWTGAAWTGNGWNSGHDGSFLTAWWGDEPPANQHIPGEQSTSAGVSGVSAAS